MVIYHVGVSKILVNTNLTHAREKNGIVGAKTAASASKFLDFFINPLNQSHPVWSLTWTRCGVTVPCEKVIMPAYGILHVETIREHGNG